MKNFVDSSFLGAGGRRLGLTGPGVLLVLACVVGWGASRLIGGRTLYLLVYSFVLMLGIAVYLSRRKRQVRAERSLIQRRAREGEVIDVVVSLTSTKRVSSFVLEETLHPHLGPTVRIPIPLVAPDVAVERTYTIKPALRGIYQIGPLTAEFADPLGLATRRQVLEPGLELIVHPTTEHVLDRPLTRAFEDPPLRPPVSRAWPEGFEFYGMRDYVMGDDLRRVVWSAFARTGKLLVREFEQGISDRFAVVIDSDEENHSLGEPSETFEMAVRVAAAVGVRHIHDGFQVNLQANYAELGARFRGPQARLKYLDELARVHRTRDPLVHSIDRLLAGRRFDSHTIIVTPYFDGATAARVNLLINGGASVLVVLIIWEESDPNSARRAREIGARVLQVKPGSPLSGVFRTALAAR